MTAFGQSNCLDYIYLYIKVLTPANYDQYFPAKGGQGQWFFQFINRFVGTPIVGALHATPLPPDDVTHLLNETMSFISPKSGSLSVVVRSYKSTVTKHAHKLDSYFSWQPGYYDTIICTTGQLKRIRKYVLDNPQNWNGNE